MQRERLSLVYPFLLAAYPVIALLGHNIQQVAPSAALRPLAVVALGTLAALIVCRKLFRSWERAAIACSVGFVLLFSYGHVYGFLEKVEILGFNIGRHRYLIPLWTGLLAAGIWLAYRGNIRGLAKPLFIVGLAALAFPIYQIGLFEVRTAGAANLEQTESSRTCLLSAPRGEPLPDIYYIILDAYARDDVLRDKYQYDNTPFLDQLGEMGFYVARGSMSNYAYTVLSLTSSLNMDYLPAIGEGALADFDFADMFPYLRHSLVRQELECLGYKTVAFASGYFWTELADADVHVRGQDSMFERMRRMGSITPYEAMLVRTSIGLVFADASILLTAAAGDAEDVPSETREGLRATVLYSLDHLADVARIQDPTFAFLHIVSPHPPFVFGAGGEEVDPATYVPFPFNRVDEPPDHPRRIAYRNQVHYTNARIVEALRTILAESSVPPIIILQGDHGYFHNHTERLAILNAYYLPGGGASGLYPTITPVNSFRHVFNTYFRGRFARLEDFSYYSDNPPKTGFIEVPNLWPASPGGSQP